MRASQTIRSWLPVTLPPFASALLAIFKTRDIVRVCVRCRRVAINRKTRRQHADHRCECVRLWYYGLAPDQQQRRYDHETFHRTSKLQSTLVLPQPSRPAAAIIVRLRTSDHLAQKLPFGMRMFPLSLLTMFFLKYFSFLFLGTNFAESTISLGPLFHVPQLFSTNTSGSP